MTLPGRIAKNPFWTWSAISAVAVLPQMIARGTNGVTHTYAQAALRLLHGQSPMGATLGGDIFKYSPLFAALYTPLALLPPAPQAALWCLVNLTVFWAGVFRWTDFLKKAPLLFWIGIVLCSMELDGSLRYQQSNALLVGLTLWGLADYRDGRFGAAGFWLGLATSLKLLPALFVALLLLQLQTAFLAGLAVAALVCVGIPVAMVGATKAAAFHLEWFHLITHDLGNSGLRDIASALSLLGFSQTGAFLRYFVLGATLCLMAWIALNRREAFAWEIWIALGLECLLLVSPRTESPTFVLLSPCYVFLLAEIWRQSGAARGIAGFLYAAGAFLVTFSFNDLWPRGVWDPSWTHGVQKTLGLQLLWFLTAWLFIRRARFRVFAAQIAQSPAF